MTAACILYLLGGVLAVVSGIVGRVPLWIAVFLCALAGFLGCMAGR